MALNVKQQIKKQGFETSQRKKKTERRYTPPINVLFGTFTTMHNWALFTNLLVKSIARTKHNNKHNKKHNNNQFALFSFN